MKYCLIMRLETVTGDAIDGVFDHRQNDENMRMFNHFTSSSFVVA